jgi:hypothetical protein
MKHYIFKVIVECMETSLRSNRLPTDPNHADPESEILSHSSTKGFYS